MTVGLLQKQMQRLAGVHARDDDVGSAVAVEVVHDDASGAIDAVEPELRRRIVEPTLDPPLTRSAPAESGRPSARRRDNVPSVIAATFSSHRNSRSSGEAASARSYAAIACSAPDVISWRPAPTIGKMQREAFGCMTQFSSSPRRISEMPTSASNIDGPPMNLPGSFASATMSRAFSSSAVAFPIWPR